jgi:DNA-binding IclR family transcriptional regulator
VTRKTITSVNALRADLVKVRTQGYSIVVGELEDGYSAMAAPIHDHEGRVVAAASVGGPSARLPMDRLRELMPLLLEATTRISKRLGYTG